LNNKQNGELKMTTKSKNIRTMDRSEIAMTVGGVMMLAGVFFGVGMSLVSPPIGLAILLGGLVVGGIIVAVSAAIGGKASFKELINRVKNGTLLATDDEQPSAVIPKTNKERNNNNEHNHYNEINHDDSLEIQPLVDLPLSPSESQTPKVLPQQAAQKNSFNLLSIFSIFCKKSNLGDAAEETELKTDKKQHAGWRTYLGFGKHKEN
jgi:hypothetical protein